MMIQRLVYKNQTGETIIMTVKQNIRILTWRHIEKNEEKKRTTNPKVDILENNTHSDGQETIDNSKTAETLIKIMMMGEEYERKENKVYHYIRVLSDSMYDIRPILM